MVAYLQPRVPTYLEELRQLCAFESPTRYTFGVNQVGSWVRDWVTRQGWDQPTRVWTGAEAGDSLVATVYGGTPGGARIMLVAHMDTVYPVGIAAERPMVQEGDRLLAPGVADNKSGLLSGLYAMAALQDLDGREPAGRLLGALEKISIVCGSDEEVEMRSSGALLRELAPEYDVALVLEAGRENGDIVNARKGIGQFVLEVRGKAAHAGVEPHKGANAILALAQHTIALQLLNGTRPGTTVSVGVVEGGTAPNVIPDRARAEIDVRVAQSEDMAVVGAALEGIAASRPVPGVSSRLVGGWRYPPMDCTPAIATLAALAEECARELGFEVTAASTGGISYANLLASMGVPVLDGLGPVGGLDHSPNEYILASSIVPRTALLAMLALRSTGTA